VFPRAIHRSPQKHTSAYTHNRQIAPRRRSNGHPARRRNPRHPWRGAWRRTGAGPTAGPCSLVPSAKAHRGWAYGRPLVTGHSLDRSGSRDLACRCAPTARPGSTVLRSVGRSGGVQTGLAHLDVLPPNKVPVGILPPSLFNCIAGGYAPLPGPPPRAVLRALRARTRQGAVGSLPQPCRAAIHGRRPPPEKASPG